jgi:membrane protein DedA with SNARE-associated domain
MMEQFVQPGLDYIKQGSYVAVFFSIALSNMSVPIPTELILGFAGYLVAQQQLVFGWVVGTAVLGEVFGTTVMYLVGFYGGSVFILKYSKYVFLSTGKLQQAQQWFVKYGPVTVFLGRVLPVVRGLIPLPAGFLQVDFRIYLLYIILSSFVWSVGLAYLGMLLGANWQGINEFGHTIGESVGGIVLLAVVYWFLKSKSMTLR